MMEDLIILGGGCAGLSLAMQLAKLGNDCPNTTIIESRESYVNDRTWCFWGYDHSQHESDLLHCSIDLQAQKWANKAWGTVLIKYKKDTVRVNCLTTPYQMLASSIFYEKALKLIAQNSKIRLILNTSVNGSPIELTNELNTDTALNSMWKVQTNNQDFLTKTVVDTRPNKTVRSDDALMWQSFLGQEVSFEDDIFDADCATLMDFGEKQQNGSDQVTFIYILPLSNNRALVELTVFARKPIAKAALEKPLANAIRKLNPKQVAEIQRTEFGVLPMGLKVKDFTNGVSSQDDREQNSYVRAGLFSGAARPSSGYAFMRIQRWAKSCAYSIASRGLPVSHTPDSVWLTWMDTLFLKVILHKPSLAPTLFMAMFHRVNAHSMVRFLSDQATLKDYLWIIFALPPIPFLMQLIRQLVSRD
jgi:lycopene beta-cyclase